MPESKQCVCALCDSMAQYEHPEGFPLTRYYECPNCKSYAISERALRYFHSKTKKITAHEQGIRDQRRRDLAKMAVKMPTDKGEILEIIYAKTKSGGFDLRWEKVLRTKYS